MSNSDFPPAKLPEPETSDPEDDLGNPLTRSQISVREGRRAEAGSKSEVVPRSTLVCREEPVRRLAKPDLMEAFEIADVRKPPERPSAFVFQHKDEQTAETRTKTTTVVVTGGARMVAFAIVAVALLVFGYCALSFWFRSSALLERSQSSERLW